MNVMFMKCREKLWEYPILSFGFSSFLDMCTRLVYYFFSTYSIDLKCYFFGTLSINVFASSFDTQPHLTPIPVK